MFNLPRIGRYRKRLAWMAAVALAVFGLVFGLALWQFREQKLVQALQGATRSRVSVGDFRRLLFPRPGAELHDVKFDRGVTLATVKRARLQSSWLYLLTFQRRLVSIDADGLSVNLPSDMPPPQTPPPTGKPTVVERFTADGSVMTVRGGRFTVQKLTLRGINTSAPITVATVFQPPHPREGTVRMEGQAGPFGNPDHSPVLRGTFTLTGAQLGSYHGLAGTLNADGKFEGPMPDVRVIGTAKALGFEVNQSGHPFDLESRYDSLVDANNGRVTLQDVQVSFARTRLAAHGTIDGQGMAVDINSTQARIEDLLLMFTKTDMPALRSGIGLRTHAEVPAGEGSFLQKLRLDGTFSMENAVWSRVLTQDRVNSISSRARGNAETAEAGRSRHVTSDLSGAVRLRAGTAHLSDVVFRIPGAVATGAGTYQLQTRRVNLRGNVRMEANASEGTTGWKSLVLKPFNFVFRRKSQGKRGATLPVSIVGTYPSPQYKVGLTR
ncbi:MAG TPA: AsmA-like C-terminal region-containing protein [Bryobacteraceae bacterium]|nr:AsmA-like C-terminal region-containing protein [Bryobacteraceae bacterium]